MYRQEEYMQILRQKFSETEILNAKKYKGEYEKRINERSKNRKSVFEIVLQKAKEVYGFDLTKVYTFNCVKYYLWRKEFCQKSEDWEDAAISFVCLSCLADLIFDSKRLGEKEKKYVAYILTKDHFEKCINNDIQMDTENPIDFLYEIFIKYMKNLKEYNYKIFLDLQADILKAFESEIYISTNRMVFPEKIDIELITSKSIEFVSSCLYLAAVDAEDLIKMKKWRA